MNKLTSKQINVWSDRVWNLEADFGLWVPTLCPPVIKFVTLETLLSLSVKERQRCLCCKVAVMIKENELSYCSVFKCS